jgi:hypothetical protein
MRHSGLLSGATDLGDRDPSPIGERAADRSFDLEAFDPVVNCNRWRSLFGGRHDELPNLAEVAEPVGSGSLRETMSA